MSTTTKTPKALDTLAADLTAAGYTVAIDSASKFHLVTFQDDRDETKPEWKRTSGSVAWTEQNTAGNNSRLGFATSYKPGVRFDYANVYQYGTHHALRSVRQVRILLGLEA